jgi:hypothetical protein
MIIADSFLKSLKILKFLRSKNLHHLTHYKIYRIDDKLWHIELLPNYEKYEILAILASE